MKKKITTTEGMPISEVLNTLIEAYVAENRWIDSAKKSIRRSVDYELIISSRGVLTLKFMVIHGPFNENKHEHSITFPNPKCIEISELVNALLHAITFNGSPYELQQNGQFKKALIVAG